MNKKFCINCLIKLSLGISTLSIHPATIKASVSDSQFLFSLDEDLEPLQKKDVSPISPSTTSDLMYYPGIFDTSFLEIDEIKRKEETLSRKESNFKQKSAGDLIAQVPSAPVSTQSTSPQSIPPSQEAVTPQAPVNNQAPQQFFPPALEQPISPLDASSPTLVPNIEQVNKPADTAAVDTNPQLDSEPQKTILINFNNVSIIEYIRFVSRISNRNFVFDETDLQFNVTVISEEPTTVENIMMALLQELRIHGLTMMEQGNNIIVHRNPDVNNISQVVGEEVKQASDLKSGIITQVFRLNTVEVEKAITILRPLMSKTAIAEVLKETNHLVITDIASNIFQIGQLLKSIDSPKSGQVIGQYVVRQGVPDALIDLTRKIMQPIALDQPLTMVSHSATNSIFIVATPYLVERTLSIMQYLDQTQATTQILNIKDMRFAQGDSANGQWELDENGNWRLKTGNKGDAAPEGNWDLDQNGNWQFTPGRYNGGRVPEGKWIKDANGNWTFQLAPGKPLAPEKISRKEQYANDLPVGHIERTKFFIYKLHYRQAALIEQALRRIGESLRMSNTNTDLVAVIDSIQSIEATNSLIFTGAPSALEKLKELIEEIDKPLRQVFLELLILETSLTDSLNLGVNWGTRFGGGSSAGSQAFLSTSSPLAAALDNAVGGVTRPVASSLARTAGFNLGVLGQHLRAGGVEFSTIGALVSALHNDNRQNIVLNPKILTEDNSPAEIFVGLNTQFPTQAIANDNGNILTQNFEYRDVGTRFKVTPLIGEGDMITLDIEEEKTDIIPNPNPNLTTNQNQNIVVGPSTSKSRTTTRVHMPNGFFLVLSGQIQDKILWDRNEIPCLGGIPIIGAAFSEQRRRTEKSNLMLFIQPRIIDTYEEMQNLTKHQQDIWKNKNRIKASWKYETQEALRYFNLKDELYPDYDTGECGCD